MTQKQLDDAWKKLQEKLKDEPENAQWTQWIMIQPGEETMWSASENKFSPAAAEAVKVELNDTAVFTKPSMFTRWKRNKYSRWVNGAIAAGLLAIVIITPIGNNALAAILGQFRMEHITVVQENEAEQLFNSFFPDGQMRESENQFGTFTRETGTIQGEFDLAEISKIVDRKIMVPEGFINKKVHVNPSDTFTLTIKVKEVNEAMSRLGATQLLPQTIDGKPITIQLGEPVHMNLYDGKDKYASFVQQPVPKINVDASVGIEEALEAVIDFPLIPHHLKSSLESSSILNGGTVPLPIITEEDTDMIKIEGYDVLIKKRQYDEQNSDYSSMWIKEGQIYELSGNIFNNQEELEAKTAELIHP